MYGITERTKNRRTAKSAVHGRLVRIVLPIALRLVLCMVLLTALSGCGQKDPAQNTAADGGNTKTEQQIRTEGGADTSVSGEEVNKEYEKSGAENGEDSVLSGSGGNGTSSGSSGGKKGPETIMKEPLHVGDVLQDGDLKIVYMASGDYVEKSEYQQPAPGCKYIFTRFAFENTGTQNDCPISLFSFGCYADNYEAQAYYGGEKELASSLSAGRSSIGNLYFCVPEDAKEIEIEYRPDHLSRDKIRFAFEGEKDAGIMPAPSSGPTPGAFHVGETATSKKQRILYLSCEKDDSDNEFIQPAEGCSFCTLTFEFENLQEEERQVSIHDFSCYADGVSCGKSLFRDDYLSASVAGGRKAKGTCTFEVPDEAKTVEVEYDPGNRSDPPVVFTVR